MGRLGRKINVENKFSKGIFHTYNSVRDAAKARNVSTGTIISLIKSGKSSFYGDIFSYVEPAMATRGNTPRNDPRDYCQCCGRDVTHEHRLVVCVNCVQDMKHMEQVFEFIRLEMKDALTRKEVAEKYGGGK